MSDLSAQSIKTSKLKLELRNGGIDGQGKE